MRFFGILLLSCATDAQKKGKGKILSGDDISINLREDASKKAKVTPQPSYVQAPTPPQNMPLLNEGNMDYQALFEIMRGPPKTDFHQPFNAFALKNNLPAAVQEHRMVQEYAKLQNMRRKNEEKNPYLQFIRKKNNKNTISCLTCSGRNYDDCYNNGYMRDCPTQEDSCFLEVRFVASTVQSVQSGCQQKVACINNMKQNFWDLDGNDIKLEDENLHHCKLFSGGQGNSVCRNCCFEDNCTDGWEPNSFDEWRIAPKSDQEKEMLLFDQFSNPPEHWMKKAETNRIEYFTNIEDMNIPPVDYKRKTKNNKVGKFVKQTKSSDDVFNLRTTRQPITTNTIITQHQQTQNRFMGQAQNRPMGAKKAPTKAMQEQIQAPTVLTPKQRLAKMTPAERKVALTNMSQGERLSLLSPAQRAQRMRQLEQQLQEKLRKTTTTKATTKKATTGPTPSSKSVSDDDFFKLLGQLTGKEDRPSNDQMRFSLNVDSSGNVDQSYGKISDKNHFNILERLKANVPQRRSPFPSNRVNAPSVSKQPKLSKDFGPKSAQKPEIAGTQLPRNKPVIRATPKPITSKASTSRASTAQKDGPWAHLPEWKIRQMKAARQRQLNLKNAKTSANQSRTIKTTPRQVNTRRPTPPPMRRTPPSIRPTPVKMNSRTIRPTPPAIKKIPKKDKSEKTSKKEKKQIPAHPQMMKFSLSVEPEALFEEVPAQEIKSDFDDQEFANMIAGLDSKDDFDVIISSIESEVKSDRKKNHRIQAKMSDDEFAGVISNLH